MQPHRVGAPVDASTRAARTTGEDVLLAQEDDTRDLWRLRRNQFSVETEEWFIWRLKPSSHKGGAKPRGFWYPIGTEMIEAGVVRPGQIAHAKRVTRLPVGAKEGAVVRLVSREPVPRRVALDLLKAHFGK